MAGAERLTVPSLVEDKLPVLVAAKDGVAAPLAVAVPPVPLAVGSAVPRAVAETVTLPVVAGEGVETRVAVKAVEGVSAPLVLPLPEDTREEEERPVGEVVATAEAVTLKVVSAVPVAATLPVPPTDPLAVTLGLPETRVEVDCEGLTAEVPLPRRGDGVTETDTSEVGDPSKVALCERLGRPERESDTVTDGETETREEAESVG